MDCRHRFAGCAGVVSLGVLLTAGCAGGGAPDEPNVLLITIDTLRADRLGCYGYSRKISPHIDALAEQSILFERFYAPLPLTGPSHAAMLTGLDPWNTGMRYNGLPLSESETTLAERLKDRGYNTAAFVSGWTLKYVVAALDQGFDRYDDDFEEIDRPAAKTTDRALDWLQAANDEPWFAWVHYFDPHYRYAPPEPHRRAWFQGDSEQAQKRSLYDGEIAYVDAQIGRLLRALEERGVDESTLVVLTADHGEALGEHGYFWDHGDLLFEDQVRVPFMMRLPGTTGGERVPGPGRSADVMPTILGALGLATPEGIDGRDLSSTRSAPEAFEGFFESNQCDREGHAKTGCWPLGYEGKSYALLSGNLKLIRHPTQDALHYRLFDIESDPAELNDLWSGPSGPGAQLRRRLDAWILTLEPAPDAPEMDHEILRKLQSLGYLR